MKLFRVTLKSKYTWNKNKYSLYVIAENKAAADFYVNQNKKDDFEICNIITLGYELSSRMFAAGKEKGEK